MFVVTQELWSSSFYVQDDWKPTDKLTLNLGLRYDFMPPATEKDNRLANFDPNGNGGRGALVYASDGSLADRALVNPDKNNFAPRVGAIYRINDQTLLRGGYGVFFNQFDRIGSEDQLALNPPGLRNIQVNSTGNTNPVFLMKDGFPPNYLDPSNLVIRNLKLRAATQDGPRTMVQQFGAGIERELARNMVVSADAVGSFTTHLAVLRNLNQPLRGTLDANGAIPYPDFGNIQAREMNGEANYKGVDFSFEKRFSDGLGYRASYTIGEARDQAPEHLNASSGRAQNTRDLESWEGPSDFDVRHRFVANFIAELPFGEGKPMLQDGVAQQDPRRLVGERHLQRALGPRLHGDAGQQQRRRRSDRHAESHRRSRRAPRRCSSGSIRRAFTQVPSGTFGNAGRNILRGPGWITFDMSVQRRIDFNSRINTTFRLDVFNVFNRANFGLPAANIAANNAGVISSLAGDPRVMQLSLQIWLLRGFRPGISGSRGRSSRCAASGKRFRVSSLWPASISRSRSGEVHMLLGENGAGKSTLMKILSGAYRKDSGEIRIRDQAVEIASPRHALELGIRVIYQELNLVPQLSVAENIFLGVAPTRLPGVIDRRRLTGLTTALLADLGMNLEAGTPLSRLSLAQRQMVEIAKALRDPSASILVMDEPTSALTSREVDQLFVLIERLVGRGVAVVYITHRLDEVYRIGQRVTVLRDGANVATSRLSDVTVAELVRLMANRDLSEHFPRRRGAPGADLLAVEHVGRNGVLRDISFTLRAGEIVGVAGLLGAGRSELARVLAGADRADTGRIICDGEAVVFRSPADAIGKGIGLLPEDRKAEGLVAGLTVARNIALPHGRRLATRGFSAGALRKSVSPIRSSPISVSRRPQRRRCGC